MYALQIFNTVIPLLTLPYITRVLGIAEYGAFSIAVNIIGYLQVVVEYGFGMSVTRRISLANQEKTILNNSFTNVLYSRLLLTIGCFGFGGIYYILNQGKDERAICLFILMISLLGYCVQQNYMFQGLMDMKYISILNIFTRTISVMLTFFLVKDSSDIFIYCLLYSLPSFLSGFFGLILAKIKYKLTLIKTNWRNVFSELKDGVYVFSTQLSSKVFSAIGITFLGVFASKSEVGAFSAIQKIPSLLILVWAPFGQVIYPVTSRKMSGGFSEGVKYVYKLRRYILPLFIMLSITIGIFSNPIVRLLFGEEYVNNAFWVLPLLAWVIVSINNNFLGSKILLAGGHDKEYSIVFQIGVVLTIIINFFLVYFFHGIGAAWAPLISDLILGLMLYAQIQTLKKKERYK